MKRLLLISLLFVPTYITATTNPVLQSQLYQLQETLDTIIMQSNLDPETTEELIEVINSLTTFAGNGDQIKNKRSTNSYISQLSTRIKRKLFKKVSFDRPKPFFNFTQALSPLKRPT